MIKGIYLSDIHMPDNIDLKPVFEFIKDYKPDQIILGGDIIDAKGMHGVESMSAAQVDTSNYDRDCDLIVNLVQQLYTLSPSAKIVYLEGNHEERYRRAQTKYPKVFDFDIERDAIPDFVKWVPYGDYESFYRLGDTLFIHGNIWPDLHAKAYALRYTPFKVVYGHLHHYQAYTTHKATLDMSPRYAVTAGCLSTLAPDWKKGEGHQWVNGFMTFISDGKTTIPTAHMIEKGMFAIGGKVYK